MAEWIEPGEGMAKIGFAIVAVILVSGVFSFWQEYRVEKTLAALRQLLPQKVKLMRDGKVMLGSAEQVVPGDIVVLEQGDNIPADCRLVEAFDVRVNNAAVTGESVPLVRDAGASDADEPIRSKNILLAGTSMVSGQAKAVVFATGMHTEFGKIARLTQIGRDGRVPAAGRSWPGSSRLIALLAIADRAAFLRHWRADRHCLLEGLHLRHRHHRRDGPRRAASDVDPVAGAGHPTHGEAERSHPLSAVGRGARLDHGHLH